MRLKGVVVIAIVGLVGVARAGVGKDIEQEYVTMLKGKGVVTKIDVKIIKIKKAVRGDRASGMTGGENLEQTKDATLVSPSGVSYRSEAHSREVVFASKGARLMVDDVSFGRSSVEMKLSADTQDGHESTIITFELGKKLDPQFSDRAVFDKMLGDTFEVIR